MGGREWGRGFGEGGGWDQQGQGDGGGGDNKHPPMLTGPVWAGAPAPSDFWWGVRRLVRLVLLAEPERGTRGVGWGGGKRLLIPAGPTQAGAYHPSCLMGMRGICSSWPGCYVLQASSGREGGCRESDRKHPPLLAGLAWAGVCPLHLLLMLMGWESSAWACLAGMVLLASRCRGSGGGVVDSTHQY